MTESNQTYCFGTRRSDRGRQRDRERERERETDGDTHTHRHSVEYCIGAALYNLPSLSLVKLLKWKTT